MIDFIVRSCGSVGYLPIIKVDDGRELYRGEHQPSLAQAWTRMMLVWSQGECQDVRDWKKANPQSAQ